MDSGASTSQFTVSTGTPSQFFVAQAYLDLLNRPADTAGLASWSDELNQGTLTRTQVAGQIVASGEYRTDLIQRFYQTFLHRPADAAGLTSWTNYLAQGGTDAGLEAALLGSSEYFTARGGGTNTSFLAALYQDILNRPIDAAGTQTWTQALANGMARSAVAAQILSSTEAEQAVVQNLYSRFLHRSADTTGLNGFVASLQQGSSPEQIIVSLTVSQEYAQNAGGDANQLYVAASGLANFTGLLDSGSATRQQVIQQILNSSEYRTKVVNGIYSAYLQRLADQGGLSPFTIILDQGGTDEQIAAIVAGSGEYFQNRGKGTNDGFLDAFYQDALNRPVDAAGRPHGIRRWLMSRLAARWPRRFSPAPNTSKTWSKAYTKNTWAAPPTAPA